MAYRKRIFFTPKQKAEIWDRWQRGEPMSSIGRLFDRESSSIYPLLVTHRRHSTSSTNPFQVVADFS